jgi:hypothetical protein
VSIEEAEKVARLVARELVESIGLDDISMARIWPDSSEFHGEVRTEIAGISFPPTAGKGYRLGLGSARRTGDSRFWP